MSPHTVCVQSGMKQTRRTASKISAADGQSWRMPVALPCHLGTPQRLLRVYCLLGMDLDQRQQVK